ncbi:hypothetical protein ACSNOK_20475 [Streptomyces sp. URMC 126]|uniref:hypothetical protein n=1 Tax=Streptomyces sp. URMC 126 TaxID=3423401 RepID=UPI003F1B993C
MWHRRQLSSGGVWSGWAKFDGALHRVAAQTNADGRVELFGVDGGGAVFHCSQTSPGGNWSG